MPPLRELAPHPTVFCFEDGDSRAKLRERARCGKTSETRAENRDVDLFRKRS